MSKKWKPGESDKSKEIRSVLFQALIKHGMSDNRLDCLDFVFETLLVSASGCFAAGMTKEEARRRLTSSPQSTSGSLKASTRQI